MKVSFLLLLTLFLLFKVAHADNKVFLPKTFLILPESSNVKIKWILYPENQNSKADLKDTDFKFFIDFNNEPNVLYAGKIIIKPLKGYFIELKKPIKDVICLDNGVLLFSDGENMGYLEMNKEDKLPSAQMKTIIKLPSSNSRLFRGENSIYSVAFNGKIKKYEVYLFDNSKKLFKVLAKLNEPIDSLTGKGEHIFFSSDRYIKEYKKGKIQFIYEHPRQEIKEITYNTQVGLIYITDSGVGLVKNNAALEFLQTQNPQIFLKGTSLYVFFSSVSGVLEIANIDDLKNYNYKIEKIIDIQQSL